MLPQAIFRCHKPPLPKAFSFCAAAQIYRGGPLTGNKAKGCQHANQQYLKITNSTL